jgi:hypothetical protein
LNRTYYASALIALTVLLIAIASPALATSSDAKAVAKLMDRSGMNTTIDSFIKLVSEQMRRQAAQIGPARGDHVREIFEAVFSPSEMRGAVAREIGEHYDAKHSTSALAWFESELGAAFRVEEEAAQNAEVADEVVRFTDALRTSAPNPDRLALAQQIEQGRAAGSLSLKMMIELMRGIAGGTASVNAGDGPVPTKEEIDAAVNLELGQLAPVLVEQMVISFLFSGRNLSVEQNRTYLEFIESDAGQWYYETSARGLVTALRRAGLAFGNHTAAWVEDTRGAEAVAASTVSVDEAMVLGKIFGQSNGQDACIDTVYDRRVACDDPACFGQANAFAKACLGAAKALSLTCKGVPDGKDLAASIYWRSSRCEKRGTPDPECNGAVGVLEDYCTAS